MCSAGAADATHALISLRYRCAAALRRASGSRGLRSASAKARLSAALSRIVWVSSMTRMAASCTLAITKSVSVRPCNSAARWNSAFWSRREPAPPAARSRAVVLAFPTCRAYLELHPQRGSYVRLDRRTLQGDLRGAVHDRSWMEGPSSDDRALADHSAGEAASRVSAGPIASKTPSRRISAWNSAAARCMRITAKNRNAR